jgi:hypothetical protein
MECASGKTSAPDPGRERGVRPNQWRYQMAELSAPAEEIVLAHFIVSDDVER